MPVRSPHQLRCGVTGAKSKQTQHSANRRCEGRLGATGCWVRPSRELGQAVLGLLAAPSELTWS